MTLPSRFHPSSAQGIGKPCRAHPLERPFLVARPRQPSHTRATYAAPSSSLAEPSACKPRPDPSRRGDHLLFLHDTTQSHIPELHKLPSSLQSLRSASLLPHLPHRKFISFATALQLAILQYCTSTRRPANLEISVLPSPHLSIIPTLRQPCRRSPFSSLRTHGRAQQPLNECVIAIPALNCIDMWRTF